MSNPEQQNVCEEIDQEVDQEWPNRITWEEWLVNWDSASEAEKKEMRNAAPELYDYKLPERIALKDIKELRLVMEITGYDDFEAAHSLEDELMKKFIRGIREGTYAPEEARQIAAAIEDIGKIPFDRYCA